MNSLLYAGKKNRECPNKTQWNAWLIGGAGASGGGANVKNVKKRK